MNRHTRSFLITLALYLSVAGLVVYQWNDESYSDKKSPDKSASRVCFSVISRESPVKAEAAKEDKKVEKKEIVKKREVVKKVEKKVEKVVQQKEPSVVPTEDVLEEVVKEEVSEVIEEPIETEELAEADEESTEAMEQANPKSDKAVAANSKELIDTEPLQAKQEMFLAALTKKINSNKYYPKSVRRRGIEGEVEIEFQVCSNGNVDNITVISGHKAFKRSAIEAILKSFPIAVESRLFDFPYHFNITLAYTLK